MKFYRLASGFPAKSGSLLPTKRGRELPTLTPLLRSGRYLSEVCTTVGHLAEVNQKCGSCRYFKFCTGGCRAIALSLTGDKLGIDPAKCLFFENGYYDKLCRAMGSFTNLTPMEKC